MSEELKLKEPEKVMPAMTARLFEEIRENSLLNPFILIGGTALSLHIGHRVSEDLDLMTLLPKLPRAALKELQRQLESNGHKIELRINPEADDDFQISGLDLADSQQDWLVDNAVKVTFFSAEPQHAKLLAATRPAQESGGGFKIASLQELSRLKAIVTSSRSKSRDWLDLFILERDHGFGVTEWKEAFDQAGLTTMHLEVALNRMCQGSLGKGDESYETLVPDPPSIEEIQTKFRSLRADYEKSLAELRSDEMANPLEDGQGDDAS